MSALKVYGQTHSPCVQAVLLGATGKKLDHQLVTATPLSALIRWGVTMPTAQFEGEDWMLESHDILHRMGYSSIEKTQRHKIQAAWQGVLHRTDNAWLFLHEFSLAGPPSPGFLRRTLQNFFRSFSLFYFFLLIRTMTLVVKPPQPEDFWRAISSLGSTTQSF